MSTNRTKEQLREAIKQQEERLRKLRAEQAELTKAEKAKLNAEIIKAIDEWVATFPKKCREEKKAELIPYFRNATQSQREKNEQEKREAEAKRSVQSTEAREGEHEGEPFGGGNPQENPSESERPTE